LAASGRPESDSPGVPARAGVLTRAARASLPGPLS